MKEKEKVASAIDAIKKEKKEDSLTERFSSPARPVYAIGQVIPDLDPMIVLPKVPKIYIASRTQKQIEQMVKELRTKTNLNPRMTILGSRDFYCVHPQAKTWINKKEECISRIDERNCTYFDNSKSLSMKSRFKNNIWYHLI